jgi:hypothetical protein
MRNRRVALIFSCCVATKRLLLQTHDIADDSSVSFADRIICNSKKHIGVSSAAERHCTSPPPPQTVMQREMTAYRSIIQFVMCALYAAL